MTTHSIISRACWVETGVRLSRQQEFVPRKALDAHLEPVGHDLISGPHLE
jgi:hypothetical protein